MYTKMTDKAHLWQAIWVSVSLSHKVNWFTDWLESSESIHLISTFEWGPDNTNRRVCLLVPDAPPSVQYLVVLGKHSIFFLNVGKFLLAL